MKYQVIMDSSTRRKNPKFGSSQSNEQFSLVQSSSSSLHAVAGSRTKKAIQLAKLEIERSKQRGELFEKDRVKLQNIFPEEIWIIVFGYLTVLTDLSNLCKSAGYLKQLLLNRRTEYLFPKAFSIFEKYLVRINDGKQMVLNEHLKCRLVCKTWCEGVDNMLPSRLGPQTFEDCRGYMRFAFDYQSNQQTIGNFIRHFKETHENTSRNPFLSRSMKLSISFDMQRDLESMCERIQELLNIYGQHIWNVNLNLHGVKNAPVEFSVYQLTKRVLEKMLNLKTLRLKTPRYDSGYFHVDELVFKDLDNFQRDLRRYGALPTLPNLETLEVHDVCATFLQHFVQTSNKLCALDLGFGCYSAHSKFYEISAASLPNLSNLRLRVSTTKQWEALVLPEHNWKLKTLAIDFEKKLCIPWNLVFQLLSESFGNSLKNLTLLLPLPVDINMKKNNLEWSLTGRPCLPNLQQLKINLCMASTIDFLLPLGKTLQRLVVSTTTDVGNFDLEIRSIPDGQQILAKQVIPAVGCLKNRSTEKQKFQNFFPKVSDISSLDRLFESTSLYRYNPVSIEDLHEMLGQTE